MPDAHVIEKIKQRILAKAPRETHPVIEFELTRIKDELSLQEEVLNCSACPLSASCKKKVPGVGPMDASIMLVGSAPGESEDEEGLPFVGKGGQLLTKALESVGWNRDDLYLTNIVKCHPEGNRNPHSAEIAACYAHLRKEIQIIQPKIIIALGATAASLLIHPEFRITQENGHWFELPNDIRAIAIYDPSYLLRLGEGTQRQTAAKWDVFRALEKAKRYQDSGFRDDATSSLDHALSHI